MSRKRAVLEHLKKDELLDAVDRFELEVGDRRVREGLVDALAGSRRAALAEILGDLSRDRLKEICRALGLDDSGREKAGIIARLAGEAPAPVATAVATAPAARAAAEAAPSSIDRTPAPRTTRARAIKNSELYSSLWQSCDALRGGMAQVLGIRTARTSAATTVYDPTCGSRSLLLKVADEARTPVTIYGQEKDGPKNRLRDMDIHKIVDVFNNQRDVPKYARMVSVAEIEQNDFNLNLPRYIDSQPPEDLQDIAGHLQGGIPAADIDALQCYWDVCPQLRHTLFKENRPGYYGLAVEKSTLKSTISEHPEFASFVAGMNAHFAVWRQRSAPSLKALQAGCHPKEVIVELSEDLLAHYAGRPLLDAYDVYQHLLDYWGRVDAGRLLPDRSRRLESRGLQDHRGGQKGEGEGQGLGLQSHPPRRSSSPVISPKRRQLATNSAIERTGPAASRPIRREEPPRCAL